MAKTKKVYLYDDEDEYIGMIRVPRNTQFLVFSEKVIRFYEHEPFRSFSYLHIYENKLFRLYNIADSIGYVDNYFFYVPLDEEYRLKIEDN